MMRKDEPRNMPPDEQGKTNVPPDTGQDKTSLTTEERSAETLNTISSPEGDSAAESKVATSLDD